MRYVEFFANNVSSVLRILRPVQPTPQLFPAFFPVPASDL